MGTNRARRTVFSLYLSQSFDFKISLLHQWNILLETTRNSLVVVFTGFKICLIIYYYPIWKCKDRKYKNTLGRIWCEIDA